MGADKILMPNMPLEGGVIAGCLRFPEALPAVVTRVSRADFASPVLAEAWSVLLAAEDASRRLGIIGLAQRVTERTGFADEGVNAAFRWVDKATVESDEALVSLAEQLRELGDRRHFVRRAYDLIDAAELEPVEAVRARFEAAARERGQIDTGTVTIPDLVTRYMREAAEHLSRGTSLEIQTGLGWVDRHLRLQRGRLLVLGARQKVGKTWLVQQLLESAGDKGEPALWFSTEMDHTDLVPRLGVHEGLSWLKERPPRDRVDLEDLDTLRDRLARFPIRFRYEAGADTMLRVLDTEARRSALSIVVVDYMQDMFLPRDWGDNSQERQAAFVRRLKDAAKRYGCLVIGVSSTRKSQDGADNTPLAPSDLLGSTAVAFTADYIVLAHRPSEKVPNLVQVRIPQSRAVRDGVKFYLIRNTQDLKYEFIGSREARRLLDEAKPSAA